MSNKRTIGFVGLALWFPLLSLMVGIDDNPPGLALLSLGFASFILIFVHRWRSVKQFGLLLLASAVGFPVAVVLHNVLDVLAGKAGGIAVVEPVLSALAVVFFFVAVFLCPVGSLIGIVGCLVMFVRKKILIA